MSHPHHRKRPGSIGGSIDGGALSPNDTLARYMIGICELCCAPRLPTHGISIIPVDYAASCIARLLVAHARAPEQVSVLHLFGQHSFDANDIADVARKLGFTIADVTWREFCDAIPRSKTLGPLRGYFGSHFPIGLDSDFAVTSLPDIPRVSKESLVTCYEFLISRGILRGV